MKEIKDRWQFIIGFAAVIISLSAFKDELSEIIIDYNFIKFSLSQYLFILTISFIGVIHLYVIPYIFSNTSYSSFKIFRIVEQLSYFLFIFIALSPTLLLLIYLVQFIILKILSLNIVVQTIFSATISFILGMFSVFVTKTLAKNFRNNLKEQEKNLIEEKEIRSLETAIKLINNGYYSQSIFEMLKILEYSVYQTLKNKNLVFRKSNFFEMINIAKKYGVYNEDEIQQINQIRIKRNEISHNLINNITKSEAENALFFVKEILMKDQKEKNEVEHENLDNKYFKGKVYEKIEEAQKIAELENKPIFLVIYDKKHPKLSKLEYSLKYFLEYDTTKNLVEQNFVQVIAASESKNIEKIIPAEESLENCLLTILKPNLEILKQERVYANPDEGLKRVKKYLEIWNSASS